ncbi:uncharacterized protein LOC142167001 [Nicotiana tabacum]|uniref:Uncharacterized protein LOC142167001 n=1 Tax=Nicotiana tabacum TaxID=4097 RepID=A0AC58SE51_TOBAC
MEVVSKVERITGGTSRHWASWNTLCMPVEEGGIGFRSLHDVAKALFSKLWWNYRTKPSLWSSFLCQKYCKKLNSPKMGSSLFWFDNWTGLGALYFLVPQDFGIDETVHNVNDVIEDGEWDVDMLFELLPKDFTVFDMPFWMLETRGYFSVKSALDYMRRRDEPKITYRMTWVKGLPFKIAFFMWKVWKAKLPLDDFMKRIGYCMPSKGWCCVQPNEESLQHLFFRSETTKTTWKYFLLREGIVVEGLTLHQAITKYWTTNVCLRIKLVMQALPSCVVWELWKRRNSMKYGNAVSTSRVIYHVSSNLQALVKVRNPGASRGNPGRSSIGFCVRNEKGDTIMAVGKEIEETTNTVAEAKAIIKALRFYRSQQYSHVWLQTDSMLLKKIMDGIWKPPWIIVEQVEEMMQLMNGDNYKVSHI